MSNDTTRRTSLNGIWFRWPMYYKFHRRDGAGLWKAIRLAWRAATQ